MVLQAWPQNICKSTSNQSAYLYVFSICIVWGLKIEMKKVEQLNFEQLHRLEEASRAENGQPAACLNQLGHVGANRI